MLHFDVRRAGRVTVRSQARAQRTGTVRAGVGDDHSHTKYDLGVHKLSMGCAHVRNTLNQAQATLRVAATE